MVTSIESIDDPRVAHYAKLTEPELRCRIEPQQGLFIAESPVVIEAALDAGCQPISLLTAQRHLHTTAAPILQRCPDIPVYTAADDVLQQLTGYALTRGVLCAMRRPQPQSVEQVCGDKGRVVVVDSVVNATNVGVIFRGAAALGMDAVVLAGGSCDPLNRRSVRVSMGGIFKIPWAVSTLPTPRLVGQLRDMGFTSVALALRPDALPVDSPELRSCQRLALLLGNEQYGLTDETIQAADFCAVIPMQNGMDSLNVAAAAAVAFWQLRLPPQF